MNVRGNNRGPLLPIALQRPRENPRVRGIAREAGQFASRVMRTTLRLVWRAVQIATPRLVEAAVLMAVLNLMPRFFRLMPRFPVPNFIIWLILMVPLIIIGIPLGATLYITDSIFQSMPRLYGMSLVRTLIPVVAMAVVLSTIRGSAQILRLAGHGVMQLVRAAV
ncbi:MAG: hypothetical protein LBC11_02135 [Puniceicoccales bacterium]|jgi:hypothetical protein|nr:hypothetical protein [Puniceicoccales bacterium]